MLINKVIPFADLTGPEQSLKVRAGIPSSSGVRTLHLQCRGVQVPSLVQELRSCILHGEAKAKLK